MLVAGAAVGKNRGHAVTKRDTKAKGGKGLSERDAFVKNLVKEVVGLQPYEKRIVELLKIGREKRALKYAKKKVCNTLPFKAEPYSWLVRPCGCRSEAGQDRPLLKSWKAKLA